MKRLLPILLPALLLAPGCGSGDTAPPSAETQTAPLATTPSAAASADESAADVAEHGESDHAHKPGMHGGIIVPIGRDSYHAEAVFEQGGTLRLFMLGADEGRVQSATTTGT